jgi:low affinity Fe/Cu permease
VYETDDDRHFSDTWQLVINTGTTIVTFLMVFLIQRSQNKDAVALHLKLNEIVAAMEGASRSSRGKTTPSPSPTRSSRRSAATP